jgi:hypothetical protein
MKSPSSSNLFPKTESPPFGSGPLSARVYAKERIGVFELTLFQSHASTEMRNAVSYGEGPIRAG